MGEVKRSSRRVDKKVPQGHEKEEEDEGEEEEEKESAVKRR